MARIRRWLIPFTALVLAVGAAPTVASAKNSQPPNPVTNVSAAARDGAVVISWRKPGRGPEPTAYVVTAAPGGKSCTVTAPRTTCQISGLVNGTAYTFTVVAKKGSARSTGAKSAKTAPASARLTIAGTLAGSLRKADGTLCGDGSGWTIEMVNPGARSPECRLNVVAILRDGRLFSSAKATGATGRFSVAVPVSLRDRKDLTLHIVRANGNYVGPIVLKSITTRKVAVLGVGDNSKGQESLGTINLRGVTGASGALTGYALVQDYKGAQGSVLACITASGANAGAPAGAGRGGYVKKASSCTPNARSDRAARAASAAIDLGPCESWFNADGLAPMSQGCYDALSAGAGFSFTSVCPSSTVGKQRTNISQPCMERIFELRNSSGGGGGGGGGGGSGDPCANQTPGRDQDSDGIPSAVDVDDNGNGIVDISDPNVDGNCTVEPSKSVRTSIGQTYLASNGVPAPVNYAAVVDGIVDEASFDAMLNELLSGPDFGIGYFIFKTDFFPRADKDDDGVMPAVWVTCAGVVWCDPQTSRATLGTNVDMRNAEGVVDPSNGNPQNWFQYGLNEPWSGSGALDGSACASESQESRTYRTPCWHEIAEPMRFGTTEDQCNGSDSAALSYDPTYVAPAGVPAGARNFFWTTVCTMTMNGRSMTRTVTGGGISPNVGSLEGSPAALDVISPFDVLTLNYLSGGAVSSIATTLGAYPITAPMIRSFNGTPVDYRAAAVLGAIRGGGRAVVLNGSDATELTVVFNRPQRQAFPGEDSDSGLHDLHGLNYGIEFEVGNAQFGCGAANGSGGAPTVDSAYTVDETKWSVRAVDGTYASFLAPLRDTKVEDVPTQQPGELTMQIELDVRKCVQDRASWLWSNYSIDVAAMNLPDGAPLDGTASNWKGQTGLSNNGDTTCIQVNLNARGEDRTGGTDSAIQSFCLQFEPGTFTSVAP